MGMFVLLLLCTPTNTLIFFSFFSLPPFFTLSLIVSKFGFNDNMFIHECFYVWEK